MSFFQNSYIFQPKLQELLKDLLSALDEEDPTKIGEIASKFTGHEFSLSNNWQQELNEHFRSSKYVKLLFRHLRAHGPLLGYASHLVLYRGADTP